MALGHGFPHVSTVPAQIWLDLVSAHEIGTYVQHHGSNNNCSCGGKKNILAFILRCFWFWGFWWALIFKI